jgi:hypothetical protein
MNEAKSLMNEGTNFDNKTKALLETDLGEFGIYEGKEVALDFPMINEKTLKKGDVIKFKNGESIYIIGPKGDGYDYQGRGRQIGHHPKKWFDMMISSGKAVVAEGKIDEADKKKKPIGKPKRGGPKAYYVYVKDGDKVKKVTFGSGGLRAKINNPKARNAFAKRHRCSTATDRTTARYWSCRLPRYAKQLGIAASNPGGFW